MTSSPTDGLSAAQREGFLLLQKRFVAGLPARWAEIENATNNSAIQSALHRLAGSAGSYGFVELEQLARKADTQSGADEKAELTQTLALIEAEIGLLSSG